MSPDVLAILPFWLPYAPPLLAVGGSLLVAFIIGKISLFFGFRALHKAEPAHWTEKARLTWGGRSALGTFILVMPILVGLGTGLATGHVSVVPGWLNGMLAGLSWMSVAFYLGRQSGRRFGATEAPLAKDIHGFIASIYRTILILGLMGLVLYLANRAIQGEWWLGLVALGLAPLLIRRELLLFGRPFGLLSRPDARLQEVVARAAQKVGLTPTAVDVLESANPNAFALLFSNSIMVTRRLLEILDDALLETIIAHELGHLRESRWVRLRRLAPMSVILVGILTVLNTPSDYRIAVYLAFVVLLAVIVSLNHNLVRAMEVQADHAAMEASQELLYATALEKIHEENLIPGHQRGGVHPSLYDRMVKAGRTPDWPRPALPVFGGMWAMLGIYAMTLIAAVFAHVMAWTFLEGQDLYVFNLLEGRTEAWTLSKMASIVESMNDALVLYREAETLDEHNPYFSSIYAFSLADMGYCEEAKAAVSRADVRLKSWEGQDMENWVVAAHQAVDRCVPWN